MPLIPVLGRQRQADLCEFKAKASLSLQSEFPESQGYTEKLYLKKQKEKILIQYHNTFALSAKLKWMHVVRYVEILNHMYATTETVK